MSQRHMGLLDISPELFGLIAENVPVRDLCNLRLASKETSDKTMHTFANKAFYCIGVMIADRQAVLRATEIAKHPAFGPVIKCIEIHTEEYGFFRHGDANDPGLHLMRNKVRVEQINAWQTGTVMPLLTTFFSQLRRHSKIKEVRIIDVGYARSRALICHELKGLDLRLETDPAFPDQLARDIQCTFEALCISGLQFQRLDMLHPIACMAHHIGGNADALASLREILPKLTDLDISVALLARETTAYGGTGQLGENSCKVMDTIASLGTNLKTVRIVDRSNEMVHQLLEQERGWHVHRLLRNPLPSLKTLILQEGRMEASDIMAMLVNQSITTLAFFQYSIVNSNDILPEYNDEMFETHLQEGLRVEEVGLDNETADKFEAQEVWKHARRAAELKEAIEAYEREQEMKAQETAAYRAWLEEN